MTIIISKDKDRVKKWAKKTNRQYLWCDSIGFWHAAVSKIHIPVYAAQVERVTK